MKPAIRVAMIHDCPFLFEGVRAILAAERSIGTVAEARNATDVLVLCCESPPDVLIVDLGGSEPEGLRMLEQIKGLCEDAHIVVLTAGCGPERMRAAVSAGAQGLVSRNARVDQLPAAIAAVLQGQCYVDPELAGVLVTTVAMIPEEAFRDADDGYDALTDREREVFRLLATGMNKKSIAYELGISPKTVETHHLRIMRKLDLHDTLELIRYAAGIGLIKPEQWAAL